MIKSKPSKKVRKREVYLLLLSFIFDFL